MPFLSKGANAQADSRGRFGLKRTKTPRADPAIHVLVFGCRKKRNEHVTRRDAVRRLQARPAVADPMSFRMRKACNTLWEARAAVAAPSAFAIKSGLLRCRVHFDYSTLDSHFARKNSTSVRKSTLIRYFIGHAAALRRLGYNALFVCIRPFFQPLFCTSRSGRTHRKDPRGTTCRPNRLAPHVRDYFAP